MTHFKNKSSQKRYHHPVAALLLSLLLAANILLAAMFAYFLQSTGHPPLFQNGSLREQLILLLPLYNIICTVAIIRFNILGFYGLSVMVLIIASLHLYQHRYIASLGTLLPLILLYAALCIGGENSGWAKMRNNPHVQDKPAEDR